MKDSTNPVEEKDKKNVGRNISFDHVIRGGGWGYAPNYLQASLRYNNSPAIRFNFFGFRLVKNKSKK
jgi:formylglycine-generating enzyme required for sulfatase activity